MTNLTELETEKRRLLAREQELKAGARKQRHAEAVDLCLHYTSQEWWKRITRSQTVYHDIEIITLYRMRKLTPARWSTLGNAGELDLRIDAREGYGTVDAISRPVVPTLVETKGLTPTARTHEHDIVLRVSPATVKEVRGGRKSWLAHTGNLVARVNVSAAPVLGFSEPVEWFAGLVPSTAEEFATGVQLLLDFVSKAQATFMPRSTDMR